MKQFLRLFGAIFGLAAILIGVDQLFFQILGEARPIVTISWLLAGGMFLAYGMFGTLPKWLIRR
jgi:hypothetical protein